MYAVNVRRTDVNPKSWNALTLSWSVPAGVRWTMWSRILVDRLVILQANGQYSLADSVAYVQGRLVPL